MHLKKKKLRLVRCRAVKGFVCMCVYLYGFNFFTKSMNVMVVNGMFASKLGIYMVE